MNIISKALTVLVIVAMFVVLFPQKADAYVSVRGYYRSDGTYVRSHVRSNPNALRYDNYSYRGGSLYNKSYFGSSRNYSSSWHTPTYITDPYYYSGRNLYNSGYSSYSSSYQKYSRSYKYNSYKPYRSLLSY